MKGEEGRETGLGRRRIWEGWLMVGKEWVAREKEVKKTLGKKWSLFKL